MGFYTVHIRQNLRRIPHGVKISYSIGWNTSAHAMAVDHKLNSILTKFSYSEDLVLIVFNTVTTQVCTIKRGTFYSCESVVTAIRPKARKTRKPKTDKGRQKFVLEKIRLCSCHVRLLG